MVSEGGTPPIAPAAPLLKITREQLNAFIEQLSRHYAVHAPVVKERFTNKVFHVFDRIADPAEMVIPYTWTILSPLKILFPPNDKLYDYTLGPEVRCKAEIDTRPRIVFGVQNCDMNAINLMDWVFVEDTPDTYYMARRQNTLFVGVNCVPDHDCFCRSIEWYEVKKGYDLYLHAIGDSMMLEVRSPEGSKLLERFAAGEPASEREARALLDEEELRSRELQTLKMNTAAPSLPMLFTASFESTVWDQTAARCTSCGACHLVCPTCFCFHTAETPNARLDGGTVSRNYDGCMLRPFCEIATGENFRFTTAARLKHRWYRKHKYLFQRVGKSFCVGCGRCGRECPVAIKPVEIVNDLLERL